MLSDNKKLKYKKITKEQWKKTPKDYKRIINGVRYILMWEDGEGTVLMPVKLI
ncbi:MAG: hypothetical protein ACYDDE_00785 [bacterium]